MSSAVIGCMGKLPCHPEFIRVSATLPEVVALDQFFQEGLALARRRGGALYEQQYAAASPIHVLWRGANARLLAASTMPSRDSAGRLFPFTIFALIENSNGLQAAFASLQPFWQESLNLMQRSWSSAQEIETVILQLADRFSSPIPSQAASDTPASIGWSADELANIADNLLAVKSSLNGTAKAVIDYGLGFPISASRPTIGQIELSVSLCRKALAAQPEPAALFIRTSAPGAMIVFHDAPLPAAFGGLLGNADISDPVFWLHKSPSGNTDAITLAARAKASELTAAANWIANDALALF